jgi:hypothetical protein
LLITFTFPNTFSELKWNSRNFLGFLFRTWTQFRLSYTIDSYEKNLSGI